MPRTRALGQSLHDVWITKLDSRMDDEHRRATRVEDVCMQ